jgi:hypothetical protein
MGWIQREKTKRVRRVTCGGCFVAVVKLSRAGTREEYVQKALVETTMENDEYLEFVAAEGTRVSTNLAALTLTSATDTTCCCHNHTTMGLTRVVVAHFLLKG